MNNFRNSIIFQQFISRFKKKTFHNGYSQPNSSLRDACEENLKYSNTIVINVDINWIDF